MSRRSPRSWPFRPPNARPPTPAIKLATWNVNGIRARYAELQQWIADERPDVVCLQEIKATPDQVPTLLADAGALDGYWCAWHGGKGYSGVALLVSIEVCRERPAVLHPPFDFEHRIATTTVRDVTVASVYVPNGGRDFPAKMRFLEALEAYARGFAESGRALAICGDLNIARTDRDVHPKERKARAIGQLPEERTELERIIACDLVDLGRAVNPDDDGLFTWWPPWRNLRARNIGWRLDYVLASRRLASHIVSCSVRTAVGTSDHAPVVAVFDDAAGAW
jgi:exodeoxyribonuclease-3